MRKNSENINLALRELSVTCWATWGPSANIACPAPLYIFRGGEVACGRNSLYSITPRPRPDSRILHLRRYSYHFFALIHGGRAGPFLLRKLRPIDGGDMLVPGVHYMKSTRFGGFGVSFSATSAIDQPIADGASGFPPAEITRLLLLGIRRYL